MNSNTNSNTHTQYEHKVQTNENTLLSIFHPLSRYNRRNKRRIRRKLSTQHRCICSSRTMCVCWMLKIVFGIGINDDGAQMHSGTETVSLSMTAVWRCWILKTQWFISNFKMIHFGWKDSRCSIHRIKSSKECDENLTWFERKSKRISPNEWMNHSRVSVDVSSIFSLLNSFISIIQYNTIHSIHPFVELSWLSVSAAA